VTRRPAPAGNLPASVPAAAPGVHIVHPTAVYTGDAFRRAFGLRQTSLRREVREGRLKVHKRCGKYFILGADVLDWLRGGEVRRDRAADPADGAPLPAGPAPACRTGRGTTPGPFL
jgi:hypothetical protein